jgi:cytochrome c-type biogenesis protein CcmH
MPLALVLAGMTALVLLALLLPLLHGWRAPVERRQFDRAVYRAQLRELERDVARGVIGGAEVQSARLEIERRLLAADAMPGAAPRAPEATPGATQAAAPRRLGSSIALAIAAALIIAGGAGLLYLRLGAPGVPDMPFAERHETTTARQAAHVQMADAAAALAARLKADPTDAEGWLLYARAQAALGNWPASAEAYAQAIALGRNDAAVLAGYGEMLVLGTDGIVGPPARAAFASALQRDAKNPIARYYLALADAQAGLPKRAIATWQGVAGDLPNDSPMREAIGRQVADAARAAGIAAPPLPEGQPTADAPSTGAPSTGAPSTGAPTGGAPGPSQDQMEAAENMSPAERDKMVRGMVAQLAARLVSTPDDLDGWLRLGRAYTVLGETDKAVDAYDHAVALKPGDVEIPMQEVEAMLANRKPDDAIPARVVTLLKQIDAVAPDRPEVLWYLGVVAVRNGQRDDARRDWQHLLTLLPADGEDHKTVVEALQAIDKP